MSKHGDKKIKEVITVVVYEDGTTEVERADNLDMQDAELIQIRPPKNKRESA